MVHSVLYYRFEAATRTGRPKPYSHFVATNIGPEVGVHPFPASIIGQVLRFRNMGLPDGFLPLILDSGKNSWVWFDLHRTSVVMPKDAGEFGSTDRDWNEVAPSFDAFVAGMKLDLAPLLHPLRIGGLDNIQPSMRNWFASTLGEDWETQLRGMGKLKRAE